MKFKNNKCFVIAEVGQAHEGSLSIAHSYIDALADSGIDAIKFQTHIAEFESSKNEKFRIKNKYQKDLNRYDYWKRMEFTEEEWKGLFDHAKQKKLIFLSSPFSIEAAKLLNRIGIKIWKVASGEIYNLPLMEYLISTRKPIILSSGMASWNDLDKILKLFNNNKSQLKLIFQCTSSYPTKPNEIGLNLIREIEKKFQVPVGFSDHSGNMATGIAAFIAGAKALEVHATFSKQLYNFDIESSLSINEIKKLTDSIRYLEKVISNPVDKNTISKKKNNMKKNFTRSIILKKKLKKNSIIKMSDLVFRKPGIGIPADEYKNFIGKKTKKDLSQDTLLKKNDVKN
jgi:N,N'-diacetyllegionaminate synthase